MSERSYEFIVGPETATLPTTATVESSLLASKSADYTILDDDDIGTILITDTSSDRTMSLPTAADNINRKMVFKNTSTDGGNVTIDAEGSEEIDGAGSVTLPNQFDAIEIQCDGSDWHSVNNLLLPRVVAKTGDYVFVEDDLINDRIFTNEGASGQITFTLASALAGYKVTIINVEGERIKLDAGSGDTLSSDVSTDLESIFVDTRGASSIFYCVNATDWYSLNNNINWTDSSARAIFGGGNTGSFTNIMDYVQIGTLSNATDFGDLTAARGTPGALGSLSRACFGGGDTGGTSNIIDYVEFATTSNATDFGDLTTGARFLAGLSSPTRGIFGGGVNSGGTAVNVIAYITIASTGNATDFGDLTVNRSGLASGASTTRGVFSAGNNVGGNKDTIDYITIASTGNATDFGDLTNQTNAPAGSSNSTRALIGGGDSGGVINVIEYITIASTGNATDFGDLTAAKKELGSASSNVRCLFGGGDTGSIINVIEHSTIASTGNGTDFGDLTASRDRVAGCSNAHGGLV